MGVRLGVKEILRMKNHAGDIRGFHISNRAWYAPYQHDSDRIQIMFGLYSLDGGTSGEMAMQWCKVGGEIVPQLQIYDDAFHAFSTFADLIEKLGDFDNENISQDQFADILISCGFKDMTAYKQGD